MTTYVWTPLFRAVVTVFGVCLIQGLVGAARDRRYLSSAPCPTDGRPFRLLAFTPVGE